MSKPEVVLFGVVLFEEAIGLLDGGDVVLAESFEKSVLESTIGAFHASFRLGRVCLDKSNVESCQGTAKLRRVLRIVMIDVHSPFVGIDLSRDAMVPDVVSPEGQDMICVFHRSKA